MSERLIHDARESFSFIEKPNGDLAWYKTKVKTYNRLSRAMNFVVGCHLSSQTEQISRWLSNDKKYPTHVIMTRITDDTNVWVDPQDSSAADSADSGEDLMRLRGKSNSPELGRQRPRSLRSWALFKGFVRGFPGRHCRSVCKYTCPLRSFRRPILSS